MQNCHECHSIIQKVRRRYKHVTCKYAYRTIDGFGRILTRYIKFPTISRRNSIVLNYDITIKHDSGKRRNRTQISR